MCGAGLHAPRGKAAGDKPLRHRTGERVQGVVVEKEDDIMLSQPKKWRDSVFLAAWLLAGLLLLPGAEPARAQAQDYPLLDEQLEPMREQFNADAGKVRLVLLLDPT